MADIQQDFFNFDLPCPEQIHNCAELRVQYKNEMDRMKAMGMCSGCIRTSLQKKYITFILASMPQNP